MVTFAFLGNTLFLTILVSMLSTTFSHIVNNAPAEIQFRRAVMTLEGVKGDAIFAYPPPFNILAILLLVPLKFCVSARWFHKIHVMSVRLINLPILLVIALAERRSLSPHRLPALSPAPSVSKGHTITIRRRFWERWRITSHSDISTVFEVPVPDSVLGDVAADDDMTRHLIRRQFTPAARGSPIVESSSQQRAQQSPQQAQQAHQPPRQPLSTSPEQISQPPATPQQQGHRVPSRRDSIAPFPGLRAELQGVLRESDEVSDIASRLETLEDRMQRIEGLLEKLVGAHNGNTGSGDEGVAVFRGRRKSVAELNREADEE
jgi:hypothetical protein